MSSLLVLNLTTNVYMYNVYNNQNNIDINIISLRKTTFVITDKRKNALKYELKV